MAHWVKRFVKEAIMREDLLQYGAMYRLNNGKYYHVVVDAYDSKEARRLVMKQISSNRWHEYQPSEYYKEVIEAHNYLYLYYIGKKE